MNVTEDTWVDRELEGVFKLLLYHGQAKGPCLPWHFSKDPYHWLIAEFLLRMTTRIAAHRVFQKLVKTYPTFSALSSASEDRLAEILVGAGLQNQRAKLLKKLASTITEELADAIPCNREALLKLPGVGDYVADAMLLFVFGEKSFPIDTNIQRVLRRVRGFRVPIGSRRANPYSDLWLKKVVDHVVTRYNNTDLVQIHRGILDIAWTACRFRPNAPLCPLKEVCNFASGREIEAA